MGACCSVEGGVEHWVYVKTGDRKGAGTDANVKIILYDSFDQKSPEINLDCTFKNDFERGKTDVFPCPPLGAEWGDTTKIELWRDNAGLAADWYCEVVIVNDRRSNSCYYFPVQRWVKAHVHYIIRAFDTSLPQDDPYPEQRKNELLEKRKLYEYDQKAPDMPPQIKDLPQDEQFSDEYKWDIEKSKLELITKSALTKLTSGRWDGLESLTNVYTGGAFSMPNGVKRWSNDICFGAQRLIGCNPTQIKLCKKMPDNLGVTAEMLRPFLEGWTLKQIIDAQRLFIVDHKILDNLPTKDDNPLCAPIALFFITGEKMLVPIAIQLYQDIAPDNPVYLPNDPPFTWILAKMWFNNADASIHQSNTHLGFTHLMMEGVCIATHRNLAVNHPIFKLLAPHFLFLLAINWRGLAKLVSPSGWVDKTMTIGREGMFELIRRGFDEWRMDVHGYLPAELESRGVLNSKVLPNYHYRDDALLLHRAIETYVRKVVRHYYDTPDKIKGDTELQQWGREMVLPQENGGIGIKGVPNEGKFRHIDDVALVCTCIIFTCSVQHAAVNFSQYDEYAFPPNYPAFLYGEPPCDKTPKTEDDVVAALPDKNRTLESMVVTKLLSSRARGDKNLGEWEFQYQYDPMAIRFEDEFREELKEVEKTIKERNAKRDDILAYPYLDPDSIPNAISI